MRLTSVTRLSTLWIQTFLSNSHLSIFLVDAEPDVISSVIRVNIFTVPRVCQSTKHFKVSFVRLDNSMYRRLTLALHVFSNKSLEFV